MSAIISEDGVYRYTLGRHISQPVRWVKPCTFIMLNPSTADAEQDDPTIRRCIGFADSWGCTHLTVVNLFALRATNPKELLRAADPVGPENNKHILASTGWAEIIVAAWGAHKLARARAEEVWDLALNPDDWDGVECLGTNLDGSPKHPLYVPAAQERVPFKLRRRT